MPPYKQFVLLGDSLIQQCCEVQDGFSFQASLQDLVMRRLDVINRGFSGYNTKNALEFLPEMIVPPSAGVPKIDYLLVLLGANDACLDIPTNSQGIPLEEYKANLKSIISHSNVRAHNPKILLVTPPPLDQIRRTEVDLVTGHGQASRHAAFSKTYSDAARSIAEETPGVTLVDLYQAIMDAAVAKTPGFDPNGPPLGYPDGQRGALAQLVPDGLHLCGPSYKIFYDIVKPHVDAFEVSRDDYCYPDWRVVNPGGLG